MTHPVLRRQLRRLCGVSDDTALQRGLDALAAWRAPSEWPEEAKRLLEALPDLVGRVSSTYEQFEREAQLKSRSLEISSLELSQANERLGQQLFERNLAVQALRELIQEVQPDDQAPDFGGHAISVHGLDGSGQDSMAALSWSVAGLVNELRKERSDLLALKAQIERENQRYEDVLSSLSEVVFRLDRMGRITYVNAAWARITGHQQIVGRRLDEFLHENDRERWRQTLVDQVLRDMLEPHGTGDRVEVRLQTSDGRWLWMDANLHALTASGHSLQGYSGTLNDTTMRRQAMERLEEQLHFVDTLFQSLPVPAFVKDSELRYRRVNEAYRRLFGMDGPEAIGRTTEEVGCYVEDEDHQRNTRRALNSEQVVAFESSLRLRDGRTIEVRLHKISWRNAKGEVQGVIGTCEDITQQNAAGRALEAARAAAETANRMKSEFLANMSHEIRTPMNGVIGMTELVLSGQLSAQQREYLELVRSSADGLMDILNEILDFSKIEAGKMTIDRISLDIQRILMEIMRSLAPRLRDGRVRLVLDVDPAVPGRLMGDPGRLRQVLNNLLSNAIKFTLEGEIVTTVRLLELQPQQARLRLSVKDSGIGIAEQQIKRIFTPFTQEDASITRRFGGTGLGLTITERLVQMMGGSIAVHSEPGKGSEFTVDLPLATETGVLPRPSVERRLAGLPVVLVHEAGTQRDVLVRLLEASGATVSLAGMAKEAAEQCVAILRRGGQAPVVLLSSEYEVGGSLSWAQAMNAHIQQLQRAGEVIRRPIVLMVGRLGSVPDRAALARLGISGSILTPCAPREVHAVLLQASLGEVHREGQSAVVSLALPPPAPSPVTAPTIRARILLAEDQEVNQVLAMALLTGWGHEVVLAADGRQAVRAFERERFDIVLMDMQMPELSGLDATREIRQFESQQGRSPTPIVAITANAMESDRQRCLEAGMNDHLAKPLRPIDLQRMLARFLAAAPEEPAAAPNALARLDVPQRVADVDLLNFDYAAALREVEPETMAIIGEVFVRNCPVEFQRLRQALAEDRRADFQRVAHSLKSLYLGFGARPLSQAAAALEQFAARSELPLQHALADVERIEKVSRTFLEALQVAATASRSGGG